MINEEKNLEDNRSAGNEETVDTTQVKSSPLQHELDEEFPLSGAEKDITIVELEKENDKSFLESLDTSFPLSGGEVDADL